MKGHFYLAKLGDTLGEIRDDRSVNGGLLSFGWSQNHQQDKGSGGKLRNWGEKSRQSQCGSGRNFTKNSANKSAKSVSR